MTHYFWNDWYSGWGWVLWFGFWFLLVSSFGNWGYTYKAHRKFEQPGNEALDILASRYARGEIPEEEYNRMKTTITQSYSELRKNAA